MVDYVLQSKDFSTDKGFGWCFLTRCCDKGISAVFLFADVTTGIGDWHARSQSLVIVDYYIYKVQT